MNEKKNRYYKISMSELYQVKFIPTLNGNSVSMQLFSIVLPNNTVFDLYSLNGNENIYRIKISSDIIYKTISAGISYTNKKGCQKLFGIPIFMARDGEYEGHFVLKGPNFQNLAFINISFIS